ncbi:MAG: tRNA lysidine(34) synthetase TilS [Bacteroidaceae bacterium]|nr:tRNA lysidine(34) synthetase TilS [Bacteroidaceae bacterium]
MINISLLNKDRLYLVALSGGADSVGLALMMKEQGYQIYALHCNFHLRGEESNRDETFVRNFCAENNIPLEVKHFQTVESAKEHSASLEMEARTLRYNWFTERALALKAEGICVAHHKEDQAETILLNLIRGTGIRGLAGIHQERVINGLKIIRPLLGVSKQEILQYLDNHQQGYVTDSTNLERDALRNRIRLDVIPLLKEINPSITECLARTAENIQLELQEETTEKELFKWLSPHAFTRQQILDIHKHSQPGHISKATGCTWCSPTHILLINRGELILKEKKAPSSPLPSLVIEAIEEGTIPASEELKNHKLAFIDGDKINGEIIVRRAIKGDRFQPFGMRKGTKLVSDYLTDHKINLLDKKEQALAIDSQNGKIVWVIEQGIDNHYRITPETKKVLKLQIRYQ